MDEDEAVARMRGADPAAGAEPDAERLAALTTGRRADELAGRRSRRAPRWAAVAAVAAGALVVGGGAGFGIGRATEDPAPAPGAAVVAPAAPDMPEGGGLDARSTSSADISLAGGYGGGRTTFTADGLSDAGGSAPAWAFDGAGVFTEETVARVAEVLGVEGEPRLEGGWNVGPEDGSGPTLNVGPDAAVSVFFTDPALYEIGQDVDPAEPFEDDGSGEAGLSVVEPLPGTADPQEATAVAPEGTAPEGPAGVLYETLAELGIDPEAAEYAELDHWAGDEVASVVAHQLVGGTRTGYSWSAELVDGEVLSFSGPLAPVLELGEYDVVSPAEAVDRLGDPRFGGTQVWSDDVSVMPVPEPQGRSWDDPPPAPPAAGAPVPWPVTAVTIVSAEPGLTELFTPDGGVLLLPAYELSDDAGSTWTVLAVADGELAF